MNKENKSKINDKKSKVFKILFLISIWLNFISIFFIVLASIFSCSSSSNVENIEKNNTQLNKNYLSSFQGINNTLGYGLKYGTDLKNPKSINVSEDGYAVSYYVSLGSSASAVVRSSNDSLAMLDEMWQIHFNIDGAYRLIDGDYFDIVTPNWTRRYTARVNGGNDYWSVQVITAPENYLYDELYLPVNEKYDAENYDRFRDDMDKFFAELSFIDYQLTDNWNPYLYIDGSDEYYFRIGANDPLGYLNDKFVSNPVYGNSLKILDSTLFSVNGSIYTDLLIHVQVLNRPTIRVYYDDYYNFKEYPTNVSAIPVYFIDYVYAYNNSSEASELIYKIPYSDDNNDNTYNVYAFAKGFVNRNKTQFRMFQRHLDYATIGGCTNATALTLESYIVYNGGGVAHGASIFDGLDQVFTIVSRAFSGLAGLLNIDMGNGFTLLTFALIPFVTSIVLTVIWLFKR